MLIISPVFYNLHGEKDWLIKPSHSRKLFEKAKAPKELKILKGGGHAERMYDAYPAQFEEICVDWFKATL